MIKIEERVKVSDSEYAVIHRMSRSLTKVYFVESILETERGLNYRTGVVGTLKECRNYIKSLINEKDGEKMEEQEQLEEEFVTCEICGKRVRGEDGELLEMEDGTYLTVCNDCQSEELILCENCSRWCYEDDTDEVMTTWGNEVWGNRCINTYAYTCDDCGRYMAESQAYFEDDGTYCEDCVGNHRIDLSYHHTYATNFYKLETEENATQFFGIELEVDRSSYSGTALKECVEDIENDVEPNFLDFKSDSSLDNGFEIASQPATYEYHLSGFWQEVMDDCRLHEFESHNPGTCGLHIHVNRSFFSDDGDAFVKLWEIFYNNETWLSKFSRRNIDKLDRWAKFKSHYDMEYLRESKHDKNERYQAINDTNSATIEFRLYRGTLKYNTFVATLQFTKWLCDYVESHTMEECKTLDFSKVEFSEYSELLQYLEERNLPYAAN